MKIQVSGTYNFRDVADYAPAVKRGVLFRSDALDDTDTQVTQQLLDAGVSTVIDLRSQFELQAQTSKLEDRGFDVAHVPILTGSLETVLIEGMSLEKLYVEMVDSSGDLLAAAIKAIIAAPQPVLVHCTAGKDRTGIVVALALAIAGISDEEIIDDYGRSAGNLVRGGWVKMVDEKLVDYGIKLDDELKSWAFSSPPSAMQALFDHIRSTHGSIEQYLTDIGITDDDQAMIRSKLLNTSSPSL